MMFLVAACVALPPKQPSPNRDASQVPCKYAVVRDEVAAAVVRSSYPNADVANIGAAESHGLMRAFSGMLEDHIATLDTYRAERFRQITRLFQEGCYRVQIVPFTIGERRLVHLHLLGMDIASEGWERRYLHVDDGGEHNTTCVIDLTAYKIITAYGAGDA